MKKALAAALFVAAAFLFFGESFSDDTWRSFEESANESWQERTIGADKEWRRFEQEQQEEWLRFKREVERKWDTFIHSTEKTWVDYGKGLETRCEVDFEQGTVEIAAIVPAKTVRPDDAGAEKIANQIRRVFSADNPAGLEILKEQVMNKKGVVVTSRNIDSFIREEIVPKIEMEIAPYRGEDGVARIKAKANIRLIPNHIKIRAERYLEMVNRQGTRFRIRPQLILAVIHTESYFNPMAKSSCGALGLMQLIPRYGAREAYDFVYGKDRILSAEYFYDPQKNIELGTAYLHLLKNRHFRDIQDALKKRYITICAYNWGPGAVKRKIIRAHNVKEMDSSRLYALLREKTPEETRDYVKKVTERMKIYNSFYIGDYGP